MPKLLKDPFVHFLVLGGALFAILYWKGPGGADPREIHISAARVRSVTEQAALLSGREPTPEEVERLLETVIREEVLYREALALGLDENDDEVRRRLVEKMQYLATDLADPEPGSEAELREFYAAHPERFAIPETATLEQIYFSPKERGDALMADVEAALEALASGDDGDDLGDRTPLSRVFRDAPREQLEVLFGAALTDAAFTRDLGEWHGPYESDFGLHLIRIVSRGAARQPAFEEVYEQVLTEHADFTREQANEARFEEMRSRYRIVLDWPAESDEGAAP